MSKPNKKDRKSGKQHKTQLVVMYKAPHHQPVPPEFHDRFSFNFHGYIPVGAVDGTGWATSPGTPATVVGLNVMVPASTEGPLWANSSSNMRMTFYVTMAGSLPVVTSLPAGFSQFFNATSSANTLYQRYTVTKAVMKLTVLPQSLSDSIAVCIVPDGVPTTSSTPTMTSYYEADQSPWAVSRLCASGNTQKLNTVVCSVDVAKYFGITPSALNSELSYSGLNEQKVGIALPASPQQLVWCTYVQMTNNVSNTAKIGVKCEIQYFVTFRNPSIGQLSE